MKIVVSGYYGFSNFGDETILSVLTQFLKSKGHKPVVLSSDPKYTAVNYGVDSINSFDYLKVIDTIKSSDMLISGGGSLLQDVTSIKSLFYYLAIIFLALFYRKKTLIFAQGIGPINSKFTKFLTINILKLCDYVSVRDEKSYEFLKSYGINANLLCDPVFSVQLPEYKPTNSIGIQLRSFPLVTENFLTNFANYIAEKYSDKEIYLLSLQDSNDLDVLNNFCNKLNTSNPKLNINLCYGMSNNDVINKLSQIDILYAMRYHALVIGLKFGIKSVAINYDIKVEKLAKDAGIPLINLNDADFSNIEPCSTEYNQNFDWSGIEKFL